MSIVNTLPLESNRQIKINFDGGDLSSDAGLLLIKEFVSKLGIDKLLGKAFKTNDSALVRYHTDQKNLLQMIYMIIAGYFEDDVSDELTNDPVFKSLLEKDALASQPTVSRFFNRMDEDTLNQFLAIGRILRKKIYSIQMPQAVILDLDSTLLDAYGRQEGRAFNFHYQSNGYHPLVCYDGMTGDLIKIVHSAKYITFKLCSSCPHKKEFYETLSNIGKLNVQFEIVNMPKTTSPCGINTVCP